MQQQGNMMYIMFIIFYCSLHPIRPLLATCSGQWTFDNVASDSEEEDESNFMNVYENSLKIWSLL